MPEVSENKYNAPRRVSNPSNEGKILCYEVIIIITILFIYFIFPFVRAFSDALSLRVNLEI